MKKLILLSISAVIYTSCSSQNKVFGDLNKEQYDILNAFIVYNYDVDDTFYVNKYILQYEYSEIFGAEYSKNLFD